MCVHSSRVGLTFVLAIPVHRTQIVAIEVLFLIQCTQHFLLRYCSDASLQSSASARYVACEGNFACISSARYDCLPITITCECNNLIDARVKP